MNTKPRFIPANFESLDHPQGLGVVYLYGNEKGNGLTR